MDQIERARVFDAPLATEIVPLEEFRVAEDYHQDYAARNPNQPYIRAVAQPKIEAIQWYREHPDEEVQ
jgi:peptide-methionine (S)-S-oxide reductase